MKAAAAAPEAAAVVAASARAAAAGAGGLPAGRPPGASTAGDAALTAVVEALGPAVVEVPERRRRSVNTPAELASAERELTAAGGSAERR